MTLHVKKHLVFMVLVLLIFPHAVGAFEKHCHVKLISHRCMGTEYPENSLEAFQALILAGIHGVEIDLRATKDGRIVLLHDETLDRMTTGTGPVSEASLAHIKTLRLKNAKGQPSACHIPEFSQALDLVKKYPGFLLALDLKTVDGPMIANMVFQKGMTSQVILFVSDPMDTDLAQSIKAVNTHVKIAVDMLSWWKIEDIPLFAARTLHADALFASEWFFPKCGFSALNNENITVMVYLWGTDGLSERFHHAEELGADTVSCDDPMALLPLVEPSPHKK